MKKFFSFGLLSVVLVFTGFGCAKQSPEKILEDMKLNVAEEESVSMELSAEIDVTGMTGASASQLQSVLPGLEKILFNLSGQVHQDDDSLGEQQGTFGFEFQGGQPVKLAGEYRALNSMMYLNLSALELPSALSLFLDTSKLTNKWIEFESTDDLTGGMMMEESEDESTPLTEEEIEALKEAFQDASLFTSAELIGEEVVRDQKTDHYTAQFDIEGVIAFVKDASKQSKEEFTAEDEEELREMLTDINSFNPEFWISKDGLLHKFKFSGTVTNEEGSFPLVVTLELYDYGVDVEVTKPEEVTSAESLFEELFGAMLGGMMMGGTAPVGSGDFNDTPMMGGSMDDFENSMQEFEDAMTEFEKQMDAMEAEFGN